jgi:2-polyprenyl-3-methyl-5-hydroxy-6-metoxy-1,4-benzoquinol methylase
MIEIHNCPVCNGVNFVPFISCRDHAVSHETFQIIQCLNCSLLLTSPRPANNELGRYYVSSNYISHQKKAQTFLDRIYLLVRQFTLKWKLKLIENNSLHSNRMLLDFGCGTGEFIRVAKSYRWQTTGVEPSSKARQEALPEISQDILPTLQEINSDVKFDVITLWHVLEHIPDLNDTLHQLKSRLNEHGTLFIAVPNHSSNDGNHYKENWAGYDVPRHLWHFDRHSMKNLIEKNSLVVRKIIPMRLDAYYVAMLSEKYQHNGKLTIPLLIRAMFNASRSNNLAKQDMQYSSLIYVVTK